jgi:hypothetical protein
MNQTLNQYQRPKMGENHWKTGIAGSQRVGEQELRKTQTIVKEPTSRATIPSSEMQRGQTSRIIRDKGTRFSIADHAPRGIRPNTRPTPTAGDEFLQDRIVKLEQIVVQLRKRTTLVEEEMAARMEQLKSKLDNRTTLIGEKVTSLEEQLKAELSKRTTLEQRVTRLENGETSKSRSSKRKKSYTLLSEIRDVRANWSRVLRGRGATLAERTTIAQAAMVTKDIPSCVIWPKEDDEEEDEEEHVRADHQADAVLADRLLRNVGWAEGRGSANAVSFESMRASMQADENFTDQEKKQANKLYGIDITAWTEDGVKPRTLTSQLKVILENSEMTIDRVQTRVGKKNESSWRLKPI